MEYDVARFSYKVPNPVDYLHGTDISGILHKTFMHFWAHLYRSKQNREVLIGFTLH